jgi:hypothetical protein
MARIATKVKAGAVGGTAGGFIAIIISWSTKQFWNVEMPMEVATALSSLLSIVFGFVNGYITEEK